MRQYHKKAAIEAKDIWFDGGYSKIAYEFDILDGTFCSIGWKQFHMIDKPKKVFKKDHKFFYPIKYGEYYYEVLHNSSGPAAINPHCREVVLFCIHGKVLDFKGFINNSSIQNIDKIIYMNLLNVHESIAQQIYKHIVFPRHTV